MKKVQKKILIFTDLDGTLLNHNNFDHTEIKKYMNFLVDSGIEIIINSSKTKEEILEFQLENNYAYSFIVENGSAIYVYESGKSNLIKTKSFKLKKEFGMKNNLIKDILNKNEFLEFKPNYIFLTSLSSIEQTKYTGLRDTALLRALKREYTIPFIWNGSQTEMHFFEQSLKTQGLGITKGGRLYNFGNNSSKGIAMDWYAEHTKLNTKKKIFKIALGDSPNDKDMLEKSDFAGVIPLPKREHLKLNNNNVFYSKNIAPLGWADTVKIILNKIYMLD